MFPIEPSGTHAAAYEFVPSNLRPARWLRFAVFVCSFVIALLIVVGIASADEDSCADAERPLSITATKE